MRIYEQICAGRTVLAFEILPDADRVTRDMDAECWLDGKRRLGYPLSAVQDALLYEFFNPQ